MRERRRREERTEDGVMCNFRSTHYMRTFARYKLIDTVKEEE